MIFWMSQTPTGSSGPKARDVSSHLLSSHPYTISFFQVIQVGGAKSLAKTDRSPTSRVDFLDFLERLNLNSEFKF